MEKKKKRHPELRPFSQNHPGCGKDSEMFHWLVQTRPQFIWGEKQTLETKRQDWGAWGKERVSLLL
jgi:hypothetical protein